MLRQVKRMPVSDGGTRPTYVKGDMDKFVRDGMTLAEVSFEGKDGRRVASQCRHYAKRHGLPVEVHERKVDGVTRCFLMRTGAMR